MALRKGVPFAAVRELAFVALVLASAHLLLAPDA